VCLPHPSETPGHRQQALGLDRLPLANGTPPVTVFQTGRPYLTGHTYQDPDQPRGVIDGLGVPSQVDAALMVDGERRGVLGAMATSPERFSERGRLDAGEELARLTPRQRDVATCIAEGLSNEEIAERLGITPGTAANHIVQMLDRLGLRSRTQIAVWAVERGLYRSGQEREDD
jgi:DNA-binding CsgD family transcriptional regulator